MTWLLSAVAALVLYVASWPLVEIETSFPVAWAYGMRNERPQWVDGLYGPLQSLSKRGGNGNPLASYHQCWEKWLGWKDLSFTHYP